MTANLVNARAGPWPRGRQGSRRLCAPFAAKSRYKRWVHEHCRFPLRSAGRSAWAQCVGAVRLARGGRRRGAGLLHRRLEQRAQLRGSELARACLFRIMRRSALRHLAPATAPRTEPLDADHPAHNLVAADRRVDDRLDVVSALKRIAPLHREVRVLYYCDAMPTAQMAEAPELAPGTVLSLLARARPALKAAMAAPASAGVVPQASQAPNARVTNLRKV